MDLKKNIEGQSQATDRDHEKVIKINRYRRASQFSGPQFGAQLHNPVITECESWQKALDSGAP